MASAWRSWQCVPPDSQHSVFQHTRRCEMGLHRSFKEGARCVATQSALCLSAHTAARAESSSVIPRVGNVSRHTVCIVFFCTHSGCPEEVQCVLPYSQGSARRFLPSMGPTKNNEIIEESKALGSLESTGMRWNTGKTHHDAINTVVLCAPNFVTWVMICHSVGGQRVLPLNL